MSQQERMKDIMPMRQPRQSRLERLRGIVPFMPGSISRQGVARNAVLRQFQNRFSVVPVSLDGSIDTTDRIRMTEATDRLVAGDVVNNQALVEVRSLVPAATLRDGGSRNDLTAVRAVKDGLREHGMNAIPNSNPITPVEEFDDEPMAPEELWSTIGGELDSLNHQAWAERGGIRNAALILIAHPDFAQRVFASQIVSEGQFLDDNKPVVLSRVGDDPRDNVLAPIAAA